MTGAARLAALRDQLAAVRADLAGEIVARGYCANLGARLAALAVPAPWRPS